MFLPNEKYMVVKFISVHWDSNLVSRSGILCHIDPDCNFGGKIGKSREILGEKFKKAMSTCFYYWNEYFGQVLEKKQRILTKLEDLY